MANEENIQQARLGRDEQVRCGKGLDWLCKIFIIIFRRRRGGDPCVYIPERIINRPDPCIYSQFLLMQLDQPVTWDNPDVKIFLGGAEQYTYDLTADTEYDLEITVHNSSREKPASGTLVDVRWIEFGAGAQIRHPLATLSANVPVWPGVAKVTTKWRTPATPGHYCIEVELSHPDDGNPSNNRGWNNTQVKAAASEVEVPIRIFNRWIGGFPAPGGPLRNRTWGPIVGWWGGLALLAGGVAAIVTGDLMPWWRWVYWPIVGYVIGAFAGYAILGAPDQAPGPTPGPRAPRNSTQSRGTDRRLLQV